MTFNITRYIPGLLLVMMMSGCSLVDDFGNVAQMEQAHGGDVVTDINDPCAIVLTASAEKDNDINLPFIRHQHEAPYESRSLAALESLGWAWVEKARDSRDTGAYRMAEQAALCIERQSPGNADALLLRGHVLHNLHRFVEAETLARRLVNERGAWFDFALLGDVLTELGALDDAVVAYQEVSDRRPGPQAYTRIARVRWLKGDLDGALEMMLLAVRSTSPRTPEAAAWAHVQLALMLMQTGELPAADAVLVRALDLKPDYPPALHASGRLLLAQERPHDAVMPLRMAVQADPLPEFRWALYEALIATEQQLAAQEQAAALHNSGVIEDRRTYVLFLASNGSEPETAVRLALQELTQRGDVFTLDAVAWALSAAGRHAEAIEYSRRALAEGTGDARLYLHAGVIAVRVGDHEGAHEFLVRAKTLEQMLLPSERQLLANEFAALQPRMQTRITARPANRTNYYF